MGDKNELNDLQKDIQMVQQGLENFDFDASLDFEKTKTDKGFDLLLFKDDYDEVCDIQASSSVEPHIWLGVHEAKHKILADKVKKGEPGWVDYIIPEDVLVQHRMHLTPEQCVALGLKLLKYGLFEEL